ncbi:hypothetical protein DIE08_03085 [Burkholderia sp. Bp9004]|nr:hypothetical protein DIE08_03085 [Burkholderia sp. Bp9004]
MRSNEFEHGVPFRSIQHDRANRFARLHRVGAAAERLERQRVRDQVGPCRATRRYRSVPVMIPDPAARRVRETAAGLPRRVTAGATGHVPEFKRRS